jgi:hypothetical protein
MPCPKPLHREVSGPPSRTKFHPSVSGLRRIGSLVLSPRCNLSAREPHRSIKLCSVKSCIGKRENRAIVGPPNNEPEGMACPGKIWVE